MASRPGPVVLSPLRGLWAVCRLHPESALPAFAEGGRFFSATRTTEELSIVCEEAAVPQDAKAEKGWVLLKLHGPIPFDATGVLSLVTAALAKAGIPVFAISTFDTDYLLVRADRFGDAAGTLRNAGVEVRGEPGGRSSP